MKGKQILAGIAVISMAVFSMQSEANVLNTYPQSSSACSSPAVMSNYIENNFKSSPSVWNRAGVAYQLFEVTSFPYNNGAHMPGLVFYQHKLCPLGANNLCKDGTSPESHFVPVSKLQPHLTETSVSQFGQGVLCAYYINNSEIYGNAGIGSRANTLILQM